MLGLKRRINLFLKKIRWRINNPHNTTEVGGLTPIDAVTVGKHTYGGINVCAPGTGCQVEIGNWCSIAPGVTFVVNSEHRMDTLSTYPFKTKTLSMGPEAFSKGGIKVDDDVWIGFGATILDGVHIGQGAVIAAEAVVTKDVAPYTIVGGCPAKKIRQRFDDETVSKLMDIDYSQIDEQFVKDNLSALYEPLSNKFLQKCQQKIRRAAP